MRRAGLLLIALLAGCARPAPEGQVIARVDGVEITQRELVTEAAATGADPRRADTPAALIETLIQRKLLVAAAEAELIDRSPAFLAEARRGREMLLADLYRRRIEADALPITPREVEAYIVANPHRFAKRTIFEVVRLDGARPFPETIDLKSLDAPNADPAIVRSLHTVDGAALPAKTVAGLLSMPVGIAQRVPGNGGRVAEAVLERRAAIEPMAAQRARARRLIAQERAADRLARITAKLRADADIAIQADANVATRAR